MIDVIRHGLGMRLRDAGPSIQIMSALLVLILSVVAVDTLVTPTPISFLITSLIVVVVPGTGVVYSVSSAISSGWQRGSLAAIGCTLGIVPHLLAAAVGLSGVMQAGATAFEIVRWVGVAYLAFLGVGMLRSTGSLGNLGGGNATASAVTTVGRGILLNLLNPKLTVFFFAFLPQFLASPPALLDARLIGLSAVFMAMTLAVFLAYAAFAAAVRDRVLSAPKLLRRIEQTLGVVVLSFAARLAVADR